MLTSEIDKIDFDQVSITSEETITYNGDGTKVVIEWDGMEPTFLSDLSYKDGPYNLEQIRQLISTSQWQANKMYGNTGATGAPN
tara:strand:- start:79 stop:330 length:252 start_codon:yes stop_codon:yes gene_type:complete